MSTTEQTISLPSLLLLAAFTALTIRYFFFTPSSPSNTPHAHPRTANPADVEQISAMFPQVGRREIIWDLQRNGWSVAATTERILGGRGLDVPPPSFQPPLASEGATPNTASTTAGRTGKDDSMDLIKRYNLAGKIATVDPSATTSSERTGNQSGSSWSNDKKERQALLQRRRDDMILNARRKLEEKDRERRT